MKYLVILPAINEETTRRCLDSMSRAVKKNVLVQDNSQDTLKDLGVERIWAGVNIGVGRAWNVGAKRVMDENLDYLIICSATMVFDKGMDDFIAHLEVNLDPHGLESQHGWHFIAIGRKTFEEIGLFDENFYPAYYEDSDFIRRMELAGIHNPMSQTNRLPKVDVAAGDQGTALALKSGVKVNMGACRDYFVEKWGFEPRYDSQYSRDLMYKYPFNHPKNALDFWQPATIDELVEKYGLADED